MKLLPIAVGLAMFAPSLAWGHPGGLDQYGSMLTAHPELRAGAKAEKKAAGERAKKEKAEDKLKEGDKTTTDEYAKDAKRKTSTPSR